MVVARGSRPASRPPLPDLRAQLQQQRKAFEEREQVKDDQMAAMQKQMADMMGQVRLMQANQNAPRVVGEYPPSQAHARLAAGHIVRGDEFGPSGTTVLPPCPGGRRRSAPFVDVPPSVPRSGGPTAVPGSTATPRPFADFPPACPGSGGPTAVPGQAMPQHHGYDSPTSLST